MGHVAETTKYSLEMNIFDASGGNGAYNRVHIQASIFSVKNLCSFDLLVTPIVGVKYGDVRSVNNTIELYEEGHTFFDCLSRDKIMRGGHKGWSNTSRYVKPAKWTE